MNTTAGNGTGAMYCAYCGRPAASLVWIGGMGYHLECTHGPGGSVTYTPPPPMDDERVRQIVREELHREERGQMSMNLDRMALGLSGIPDKNRGDMDEVLRLRGAIQEAIDYANGRESEWGDRAEMSFGILYRALSNDKLTVSGERQEGQTT